MLIDMGRANDAQRRGTACVVCGMIFKARTLKAIVGSTGWPSHHIYACDPGCADQARLPVWPEVGSL